MSDNDFQIELNYDRATGILRATATGVLDFDRESCMQEFIRAMLEIVGGREYHPAVPTIWDLRQLDFSRTNREQEERLVGIRERFPLRKDARLAYVVGDDFAFGMVRMLDTLMDEQPERSNIFYDYQQAEHWLLTSG